VDSRRMGGSWTSGRVWDRLGIAAAIRRVATGRRLDGDAVERCGAGDVNRTRTAALGMVTMLA
jgi:hypothetical protein